MRPELVPPRSDLERRVAWREECLLDAGFPRPTAQRIGRDMRFDLHALLELVDRGCPLALAVRIVAPLDSEGTPP
jgi:hypothetical protein